MTGFDINQMTKEQMKNKIIELQDKVEELENDVDYWQREYNDVLEEKEELECEVEDLKMKGGVNDLDNFIRRLKLDGLYCDMLQKFIDDYIKYHNEE